MSLLRTEKKDQVLFIYLADLETQNAFSPHMAEELHQIIVTETFSGLVVSHVGPIFCSGGNLKFYKNLHSKEEGLEINKQVRAVLKSLKELPVPKACFVDGPCLGGGVELLSCFDHVISSPQALFGLWQRRVGLSYGWGGGERLLGRLSEGDLRKWLLEAKTITAYKAQEIGLIDAIVFQTQGLEECFQWIMASLSLGLDSLECILSETNDPSAPFEKLWHGETHMNVLKKFK